MHCLLLVTAFLSLASAACPYSSLPSDVTSVCAFNKIDCQNASLTTWCVVDRKTCAVVPGGDCNAVGSYTDMNETAVSFGDCEKPYGGPVYLQELVMTPQIQQLNFKCLSPVIPVTMKWPPNLLYLYFYYGHVMSIPTVPSTLLALGMPGCQLRECNELTTLSKSIIYLDISNNAYSELTNLDWTNLTYVKLGNNKNLRRIQNVTFGDKLLALDLTNLVLTSWIMSDATYKFLELKLTPEHPQTDVSFKNGSTTAGYMVNGASINSDQAECEQLKGTRVEIWSKTKPYRIRDNMNKTYMVCVLPEPSTNSGLSTAAIVGIAAGAVVLVGLGAFFVIRRHQRQDLDALRDSYRMSRTPVICQADEEGLNMQELRLCRLDDKDLKMQRKLGSGAFAEVRLATFQGESVAVKKMHASRVTVNQLKSFIDEIKLMATFDSPYIVKLIGAAWTRPSDLMCVMELMNGGDLKDHLDHHNANEFTWNDKYMHIQSIVEGLVYLHSLNIIHRDIKSRNILLDSKKGTKLTDFGISKEDMQATMTMGVGTFRWMAPEVIQDKDYTISADIYSFGMLLSEFDTHHIPYEDLKNPIHGQPSSDSAIMLKVVDGSIKPTFTANCPPWVLKMAMACLVKNPDDRPTSFQLSSTIRAKLRELGM
ncbi:Aste57867_11135 [Aphanomyces stellatus]|uniref:Aste57867_11135 protein n=1 Tax=Aphanomyces stellatus TaxID=120398 RepID=A0A485KSU2_9STRA|nr:hypothetical protein As57867_011093 [Aphanomyces stellatus]VFT88002.1 Aste57867_11135 [Aphanomyces stellatus]